MNQPSEASIPDAPTSASIRHSRSTAPTPPSPRRQSQTVSSTDCTSVTKARVKAGRISSPPVSGSASDAAR